MVEKSVKDVSDESRLLKKLYFWSFIAFGFVSPFSGIFLKKVLVDNNGETDVMKIGIILSAAPVMGLLANLIAGIISDKTQKGRHIISWLSLWTCGAALFVAFAGTQLVMSLSLSYRFIFLFVAILSYRFSMMPINALVDSELMQYLSDHSDRSQYGTYRFWGTIGWAVATPIMGLALTIALSDLGTYQIGVWNAIDSTSEAGSYATIFFLGALAYGYFGWLSLKARGSGVVKKIEVEWSHLMEDKTFLIFLVFAFLAGVVENSTSTYLGFFFDDVMDTPLKIGLIFSFWTTLEIPVMKYSKQLINKLGNRGLILLGLLLNSLKLILFSLFTLETPFYLQMLAALIHGPAFAFLFLGTIDTVDKLAHNTLRATYMSTTSIARYTLAAMVGSVLGAKLIELFGGAAFMQIGAVAFIILIPIFVFFVKTEEKCKKHLTTGKL